MAYEYSPAWPLAADGTAARHTVGQEVSFYGDEETLHVYINDGLKSDFDWPHDEMRDGHFRIKLDLRYFSPRTSIATASYLSFDTQAVPPAPARDACSGVDKNFIYFNFSMIL